MRSGWILRFLLPIYRNTETPKHRPIVTEMLQRGWFGSVKEESKTQDFKTQDAREEGEVEEVPSDQ